MKKILLFIVLTFQSPQTILANDQDQLSLAKTPSSEAIVIIASITGVEFGFRVSLTPKQVSNLNSGLSSLECQYSGIWQRIERSFVVNIWTRVLSGHMFVRGDLDFDFRTARLETLQRIRSVNQISTKASLQGSAGPSIRILHESLLFDVPPTPLREISIVRNINPESNGLQCKLNRL